MDISIPKTFGALLIGGLFASVLSGFVIVQVVVYFRLYPADGIQLKVLVLTIWLLDTCHTTCIWLSLWSYFIDNYQNLAGIDVIHWSLAVSVVITAVLTFLVHIFLAHRIYMLSKHNYLLTVPIVILAILRVVSGSVTTAFMLKLHTFTRFRHDVTFIFTTGLALSTAVDILITASLFALLNINRTGAAMLDVVIDSLIRYTFETASLTCAGTIASMLCWTIIPHNLIFMGLHFVIGKLYANSLLVTLNIRDTIRRSRSHGSGDHAHGVGVHIIRETHRKAPINYNKPHDSHSDNDITLPPPSQTESKLKEERVEMAIPIEQKGDI